MSGPLRSPLEDVTGGIQPARANPHPSRLEFFMHFHDDALFPENQDKLVITVAPYGPEWEVDDFPEDLPLTMDEHVQQAVDCFEAGATVLHIHVRELDGKGSKRLSKFNELLGRLREAVPEMILQVGGSISFAPEGEGAEAKWLSDDTRHMLAELDPAPDQVTIAINTSQMNIMELMTDGRHRGHVAGASGTGRDLPGDDCPGRPDVGGGASAPSAGRRNSAALPALASIPQLETVERLIRRGFYTGPLNLTWVGDRRRLRRAEPVQHDGVHPAGSRTAPA